MWVVRVQDVLKMKGPPRSHQELLADGLVVEFRPRMTCTFVSHQWLGREHPDESGKHLRVLQKALANIISANVKVYSDVCYQFMGTFQTLSPEDIKLLASGYIWLDWWSLPQTMLQNFCWIEDSSLESHLKAGLRSIPFFIGVSKFFIQLAPPVKHEDTGEVLDFGTYLRRGWCRAETWVRCLACMDAEMEENAISHRVQLAPIILVTGEDCIEFAPGENWRHSIAHEGQFSVESDRRQVREICRLALNAKLREARDVGDLDIYRVLGARYEDFIGAPVRERSLEEFLDYFAFSSLKDAVAGKRGIRGLACATLAGDLPMMRFLVEQRASLTSQTGEMFRVGIGPGFTPLHMSLIRTRSCVDALQTLLDLMADPNISAGASSSALGWCQTAHAVDVLVKARAEVNRLSAPPLAFTPLQTAAMTHQKPEVFAKLLELRADVNIVGNGVGAPLMNVLAVYCHLGYPERLEVAELLIDANADLDAVTRPKGVCLALHHAACFRMRLRRCLGPPPLLFKIFSDIDHPPVGAAALVGEASMVDLLLKARANPFFQTCRGMQLMDLARSQDVRDVIASHLGKDSSADESDHFDLQFLDVGHADIERHTTVEQMDQAAAACDQLQKPSVVVQDAEQADERPKKSIPL